MQNKIIITSIVVLIIILMGVFYFIYSGGLASKPSRLQVSESVDTDIQTPHPYQNSDSGTKMVWTYTLNHPGATSIGLHFSKFDIKYEDITSPVEYNEIDYGECDLNAPEGYERKLIDPNTISEIQIVEQKPGDLPRAGSSRLIKCGVIKEKEEYTDQEIFNNNWIEGDFLLIKDKEGNVIKIINKAPFFPETEGFMDGGVSGDTMILELYADEKDNGYGFEIDYYLRGFTDEERERANKNSFLK